MANIYQSYRRQIANGEIYEANVYGKWVSILTWANAIDVLISVENQIFSPIKAGMSIKLPEIENPFYNIKFQNVSGVAVVLEFAVSDGQILDNRFNAVGVVIVNSPGLTPANGYGLVAVANVAPGTLVVPLNLVRRSVIIQNQLANAGDMFIGFDNLLTNINYVVRLVPGAVYTNNDYTGDIYVLAVNNLETVSFGEI